MVKKYKFFSQLGDSNLGTSQDIVFFINTSWLVINQLAEKSQNNFEIYDLPQLSNLIKSYGIMFIISFFNFILFYFLYSRLLLVIYFIHISVYMSIPISQFIPPPPPPPPHNFPPLVSISLFSTSVSLFLPCKSVHLYHFSRFHIYALMYDICSLFLTYFTLYDSLQIHPRLYQ